MMKLLFALLLAGAMVLEPKPAASQGYPTRQIHIIVTFPPGGNADTVARLIADKLTQQLGQPVIVENKPGAASIVGTSLAIQSPADGYMLLQAGTNVSTNPALGHKTPYDAERDLVPVVLLVTVPAVIAVNPRPAGRHAGRAHRPCQGQAGRDQLRLGRERLVPASRRGAIEPADRHQADACAVPRIRPAMIGLLRNDVGLLASDIPGAQEHIRAGKLRPLAVTGSARMPQLPDVPTVAQAGVPGYDAAGFLGIMVRTGTPRDVIDILNREINRALATPEITRHIAQNGLVGGGGTPDDFAAFLRRDKAGWSKVIVTGGIKGE